MSSFLVPMVIKSARSLLFQGEAVDLTEEFLAIDRRGSKKLIVPLVA